MKDFKFFKSNTLPEIDLDMVHRRVQTVVRGREYIPAGFINVPIPTPIPYEQYVGWAAHYNNLPPGQCPYDIGTIEREHWMTGWSSRENREPRPYETI